MRIMKSTALMLAVIVGLRPCIVNAQATQDVATTDRAAATQEHKSKPDEYGPIEEIMVTAQKAGAQTLQSVPLAIQAFGGAEMKEMNVNDLASLISMVPGTVESQQQSVASRSYSMRGVGGSNANGDSPVGYYVDDVAFNVINFGIAPPIRFIDIDRVEVLRGPQGTLYGQGAAGGVFIFHTKDPNLNDYEYGIETFVSKTSDASGFNYDLSGVFSAPLIEDKLAVRVSGGTGKDQGFADEYYGPYDGTPDQNDVNVARNDDIRAVLLYRPTEKTRIRAQYWKFRPRQQFLGFLDSVLSPAYIENTAAQPSYGNGDFTLYSLVANIDFENVELTSATSYMEGQFGIEVPIAPEGHFSSQFFPNNFSEEIRANSTGPGPFNWIVGAQYQDGEGPQENQLELPFIGLSDNADNNTLVKNWAVFGEVSYDLLDGKFVPLVGLRQYHESRTFADGSGEGDPTKTNVTTWRVNLSYLPSDDLTLFVTAATGFRPGIVQSQLQVDLLQADGIPAELQLNPEDTTNYEFGLKWRSTEAALSVGLNAYYTEIQDQQTSVTSSAGVGGFINFGDARVNGIDFELRWATPLEGFTLSAVGNVNNGEYTHVKPSLDTALPAIRVGERLVNAVEYSYRFDAGYIGNIRGDLDAFVNVSYSRVGDKRSIDGRYADPYSMVSATLGVRRGPWELALVANNIFDERGPTSLFFAGNDVGGIGAAPRTVGLRLRGGFQ